MVLITSIGLFWGRDLAIVARPKAEEVPKKYKLFETTIVQERHVRVASDRERRSIRDAPWLLEIPCHGVTSSSSYEIWCHVRARLFSPLWVFDGPSVPLREGGETW